MLKRAKKHAVYQPRKQLLETKEHPNETNGIVCVTTYNTRSTDIKKIVLKYWNLVASELQIKDQP